MMQTIAMTMLSATPARAMAGKTALVIGAGAAGMAAANLLIRNNVQVQILEAAPVWGGRVKQLSGFADFPIDVGAEWIHTDPNILNRLADDQLGPVDIDTITYRPGTYDVWEDGETVAKNWIRFLYREHKFLNTTWFGFIERFLAPPALPFLQLNAEVTHLRYRPGQVTATLRDGRQAEADMAVVTVPVSVLQSQAITFDPPLPKSQRDGIQSIGFGGGLKAFFRCREKFYADIVLPDGTDPFMADSWDSRLYYDVAFGKQTQTPVLGLFFTQQNGVRLTQQKDADIARHLVAELDRIYQGAASRHILDLHIENWSRRPFVRGTYSMDFDDDRFDTLSQILKAPAPNLHFAGEALGGDAQSTVHGACLSGLDAVARLLDA